MSDIAKKPRIKKCKPKCDFYKEVWNKNGSWFIPYNVKNCDFCEEKDGVYICTKGKKEVD